jgi:CheY-like chemotaxis protein
MVAPIVDEGASSLLRASNRRNPGQLKLLVVDDDGASRAVLRSLLKQHLSALVSEAEDGAQALDMIERGAPDAVFLDLQMPVMDGLEVLEMLRKDPAYRSLPVVVLSALSDRATVQRAISLGIADYLVKPLRPLIVDTRILALLTAIEKRQRSGRPHPWVRPTRGSVEGGHRLLLVDNDVNFGAFFVGLFE